MRLLHTADWHLGRRFEQVEMTEEHNLFLHWLTGIIDEYRIDLLVVAGDIFDSGNPPAAALRQYYDFLWRVKATCCRSVVIIGGNHDSPATLNAPQDLLKFLDIHVVGGTPEVFEDQVIPIMRDGAVEAVVCAVPFLRDKDIRLSVPGETAADRERRIKEGIAGHYRALLPHVAQYKEKNIPLIATGHLFAAGATSADVEREIHAGSLGQIGADEFPAEFDYIALGHLHRPQLVHKRSHIRYPGSPVALSFSEALYGQQVLVADFEGGRLAAVTPVDVPRWRQMISIKGSLDEVKHALEQAEDAATALKAWAELIIEVNAAVPDIYDQLDRIQKKRPFIERYIARQVLAGRPAAAQPEAESLSLTDWTPESVFAKWCGELYPGNPGEAASLTETFLLVLQMMQDEDGQEDDDTN